MVQSRVDFGMSLQWYLVRVDYKTMYYFDNFSKPVINILVILILMCLHVKTSYFYFYMLQDIIIFCVIAITFNLTQR